MSLTDKEAAALERLEQERERRIEQKIADGSAIRVPLPIVHGNAADVRARKLAMLREAGERREIFFDEDPIDTGVPRALDSYGQRSGHDASGETRTADQPKPAPVVQHEGDTAVESQPARRLRTQIEQPSEANPAAPSLKVGSKSRAEFCTSRTCRAACSADSPCARAMMSRRLRGSY